MAAPNPDAATPDAKEPDAVVVPVEVAGTAEAAAAGTPTAPKTSEMSQCMDVRTPTPAELTGRYKPNCWERFLAGEICCPCCSCWTFFAVGWLFTFLLIYKIMQEGGDIFSFDAQPVESNHIVQQYYAFGSAKVQGVGCSDDAHKEEDVCKADEKCKWTSGRTGNCVKKDLCISAVPPKARSTPMTSADGRAAFFLMIYEAKNGKHILDDKILGHIRDFEKELLTKANGAKVLGAPQPWDDNYCLLSYPSGGDGAGKCSAVNSLINAFVMNADGRKATQVQADAHFSAGGQVSQCFCKVEAGACTFCGPDGNVEQDLCKWSPASVGCMMGDKQIGDRLGALCKSAKPQTLTGLLGMMARMGGGNASATTTATASGSNMSAEMDVCAQRAARGQGMSMDMSSMAGAAGMLGMLGQYCGSMKSCQWGPPTTSICSSRAFFHPHDATALVTGAEKDTALDNMCDEKQSGWWAMRKSFLPGSFKCEKGERKTKYARSTFVAGRTDTKDEEEYSNFEAKYIRPQGGWYTSMSQFEEKIEVDSGGDLRIILYSGVTLITQFLEVLMWDGIFSLGSLVMVWAYMWWTLESFFLASAAMFEIVFSLPVAFFFWTVIGGQKIIFTQMLVIYLILGIGADDAFILYDAWVQALQAENSEVLQHWTTRFAYAYRKSFQAMAITTATTCASFVVGACSPLPAVRKFCIFAGMVVMVDWLFCETFFAACIVVHERYFCFGKKPGQCLGPGCCWGCPRACSALLPGGEKRLPKPLSETGGAPPKRAMERFCEGPLFNTLLGHKLKFLSFWGVICGASAISAAVQLRTADKRAPLGRQDLDVIRGFEILLDEFTFGGAPSVTFVYGIDTDNAMQSWDNEGKKKARFLDNIGHLSKPEGQVALLTMMKAADLGKDKDSTRCGNKECLVLGRSLAGGCKHDDKEWQTKGVYMPEDITCASGRYCFMEEFADYWAFNEGGCRGKSKLQCSGPTCLWGAESGMCYSAKTRHDYTGLATADFEARLKSDEYAKWRKDRLTHLRAIGREYEAENFQATTGFRFTSDRKRLQLAYCAFNGTIPRQNSVEEANAWYANWEEFRKRHGEKLGGYQTTAVYDFMITQNEMVKSAVMGICLSIFVTWVVLTLSTRNWIVSALGVVCIMGVSLVVLGIMPLLGWQLGENECIFIIAVVGLSVDYTVHLLHSFKSPKYNTREDRARHALSEMGISVTNSAITTLLAAAMLFACGFYFFFQFGAFIFFVICFSILMAISFLIPLLLTFGPQGDAGKMGCLYRKNAGSKERVSTF